MLRRVGLQRAWLGCLLGAALGWADSWLPGGEMSADRGTWVRTEYGNQRPDGTVLRDSLTGHKEAKDTAHRLGLPAVYREVYATEWQPLTPVRKGSSE